MLIITMIFLHIIADFNLQGWLANGKQRSWWEENAPAPLYKYDYLCALALHSFSWCFIVMLPLMYVLKFDLDAYFWFMFWINVIAHGFIDNAKANQKELNLIADQVAHIGCIIWTILMFEMVNII